MYRPHVRGALATYITAYTSTEDDYSDSCFACPVAYSSTRTVIVSHGYDLKTTPGLRRWSSVRSAWIRAVTLAVFADDELGCREAAARHRKIEYCFAVRF